MGNFAKSFKARLLSPRIFVYALMAVLCAWFMRKYSPSNHPQSRPHPAQPAWHEQQAVEKTPILILFYDQNAGIGTLDKDLEEAAPGSACLFIAVDSTETSSDSMNAIFNITTLPCLLLVDGNNQEQARLEGNITQDGIRGIQAKLPENTSQP